MMQTIKAGKGSEFYNTSMKSILQNNDTCSTQNETKSVIAVNLLEA